jgi:hypothetical protein
VDKDELAVVREVGGGIILFPAVAGYSTSTLLNGRDQ